MALSRQAARLSGSWAKVKTGGKKNVKNRKTRIFFITNQGQVMGAKTHLPMKKYAVVKINLKVQVLKGYC